MKKSGKLSANLLVLVTIILIVAASCKKDNGPTTISDIDGNVYNILTIGSQKWMKENLKTITFNDGTPIPLVTGYTEWFALITPGYCWYDNNIP